MLNKTLTLAVALGIGCADATDSKTEGLFSEEASGEEALDTAGAEEELWPSFVEQSQDGASVQAVEPERYLGLWYEIATTPSFQQTRCTGTTAEYSLREDGLIGVLNRCYLDSLDGSLSQISGTATPIDDTFARLLVDLGFGFDAPYYVVDLDGSKGEEPYEFAVVSSGGQAMWILHRSPQMDPDLYDLLIERALERGLPVDDLMRTEQPDVD